MRTDVTKVIQVKTGILVSDMPGARMFRMVTMKLRPAAMDATPRMFRPMTQKFIPLVGLKATCELGA